MSPTTTPSSRFFVHRLTGCRPDVLAHYLKALGMLRLVGEQVDPEARGFWERESFVLLTRLSEHELLDFFAKRYAPTALVSPWNQGSGFFTDNDPGVSPLEESTAKRFAGVREGICAGRALCNEQAAAIDDVRAIKAESNAIKDKRARETLRKSADYKKRLAAAERRRLDLKAALIPLCRQRWRGPHLGWLNAALVLDDERQPRFPALLGTGGNDGRLDFTNNFLQRLGELFDVAHAEGRPKPGTTGLLRASIFGTPDLGLGRGTAVGQFFPGAAGGANSTTGPSGESLLNPWDFVLSMEGTLLFSASATRRCATTSASRASAPFAVGAHAIGYSSAGANDESARGEQWMPLWGKPWTLREVRRVLAEGRCQVGARASREPVDLARSIARLGVARGIDAFQRFGYIERNGQSNLAVPLGRWPVRVQEHAELIDDLDQWLAQLHRAARSDNAPASLVAAERRLGDVVMAALSHDNEAGRWQSVLLELTAVEDRLVASRRFTADRRLRPVPLLRPGWVKAINDGSTEVRLALALAGAAVEHRAGLPVDPVRHHWIPLDGRGRDFAVHESGLANDPRVVCHGREPETDLIALVERRLVEASQSTGRLLPIAAAPGCAAQAPDLARLLAGEVDLRRCVGLARALMALNWQEWRKSRPDIGLARSRSSEPDDCWKAIRLANLPWPLDSQRTIAVDPAVVRRLSAGDGAKAVTLALHRLRVAGIVPGFRAGTLSHDHARRVVASLAFPISKQDARRWAVSLIPNADSPRS